MSQLEPIGVAQLITYLKQYLNEGFSGVYLKAEIAQIKHQRFASYLTLKDTEPNKNVTIAAVSFDPQIATQNYQQGNKVEIYGEMTVYEKTGSMQLRIKKMRKFDEIGEHLKRIHQLKEKIILQGWDQQKKPIPKYCKTIALLTSDTGEVKHDMLRVFAEIGINLHIIIVPTIVQGEKSVASIVQNIQLVNSCNKYQLDLLIVARGGGSFEELLPFSDEQVVQAVHQSKIPVISAIGHERDDPLINLVSDFAASTPTAAAHYVVKPYLDLSNNLKSLQQQFNQIMIYRIKQLEEKLFSIIQTLNLYNPTNKIDLKLLSLKQLKLEVYNAITRVIANYQSRLDLQAKSISYISNKLRSQHSNQQQRVNHLKYALLNTINQLLTFYGQRLNLLATRLNTNSPEQIISLGYSILRDQDGNLLKSVPQKNQLLNIVNKDFTIDAKVIKVHKNKR